MKNEFVVPVRNLHGSNMETLMNQYIDAIRKINAAMVQITEGIDFHARDYGTWDEFIKAKQERLDALKKLYDVHYYLRSVVENIDN
jgi:hypothetical protein